MAKKGDMVYAWTNDKEIAEKAELGGAVTGLLKFALEKKIVDAVFAVKKRNRPLRCSTDPDHRPEGPQGHRRFTPLRDAAPVETRQEIP